MATREAAKLAVLIDADNAQALVIQELLAEVSRYGASMTSRGTGRQFADEGPKHRVRMVNAD